MVPASVRMQLLQIAVIGQMRVVRITESGRIRPEAGSDASSGSGSSSSRGGGGGASADGSGRRRRRRRCQLRLRYRRVADHRNKILFRPEMWQIFVVVSELFPPVDDFVAVGGASTFAASAVEPALLPLLPLRLFRRMDRWMPQLASAVRFRITGRASSVGAQQAFHSFQSFHPHAIRISSASTPHASPQSPPSGCFRQRRWLMTTVQFRMIFLHKHIRPQQQQQQQQFRMEHRSSALIGFKQNQNQTGDGRQCVLFRLNPHNPLRNIPPTTTTTTTTTTNQQMKPAERVDSRSFRVDRRIETDAAGRDTTATGEGGG